MADVSERDDRGRAGRLTARGSATRERILQAAADLMRANGVAATTLDEVRVASGTSKSQLYRHFPDKDALVHAVIAFGDASCSTLSSNNFSG